MDKIAYLKGLLDGQEIDRTTKEGKVLYAVVEALEELVRYNGELEDRIAELEELCEILDEDLGDVEEQLLDDDIYDCEDCPGGCDDDFEDGEYETICPTCGKCIPLDAASLEEGETVCPNCGEGLEFDFDEQEIEALAPSDTED